MRNIFKRFYLIILIIVIAMATLLGTQYNSMQKTFENEILESTKMNLSGMVFEIDDWLDNQRRVIETAASFITYNQWSEELTLGYFELLLEENPNFSTIYLGTEENLLINASGWVPPEEFDLRERPWYVKASAVNEIVLTEFFKNASNDDQIISIARSVFDAEGNMIGVVGGDITSDTIYETVQKYQFGGIQNSVIVNMDKEVLMVVGKSEDNGINQDYQSQVLNYIETDPLSDSMSIDPIKSQGNNEYICRIPIDGTDWQVYSLIKVSDFMAFRKIMLQGFLFIIAYMVLFVMMMMWVIKRRIIMPINQIEKDVEQINLEDNLTYRIEYKQGTSFDQLVAKINEMLERWEAYFLTIKQDQIKLNQMNVELKEDLTLSKQMEEMLSIEKTNLEALFKNSTDSIVLFDKDFRVIKINKGFTDLFGYELADIEHQEVDSVIADEQCIEDANRITNLVESGQEVRSEGIRKRKNGEWVNVTIKGIPIITEDGLTGGFVIYSDISDRQHAEIELKRQMAVFEDLFRNSTDAIVMFDNDKRIVDINDNFTMFFEYELGEIKGKPVDNIVTNEETYEGAECLTVDLLNGNKIICERIRFTKSGMPRDVLIKGIPIFLEQGVIGGYGIYTDISVRKRAEKEILYISYHDQLTGLYNRRFFEEEFARLDIKRNMPLALIMADVNGLKLINDAFGHQVGDDLLQITSRIFENVCRGDEIIARLGGDEFVILLPNTHKEHAETIVQRIKKECHSRMVKNIEISISFGWDVKESLDDTYEDLFKRVEDYMYRNKLIESPNVHARMFETVIKTLHEKNPREERHSVRVSELCASIAKAMAMSDREIEELRSAGWLHDIGKVAIKESVLNKESSLDDDDWTEIKRHPEIGYRIISTVNEMAELAEYVLVHHERWDGKGYPRGIGGEDIPLQGRILAIADAYDTMTRARVYQEVLTKEMAISEMKRNSGSQFDPEIVEILIEKVLNED